MNYYSPPHLLLDPLIKIQPIAIILLDNQPQSNHHAHRDYERIRHKVFILDLGRKNLVDLLQMLLQVHVFDEHGNGVTLLFLFDVRKDRLRPPNSEHRPLVHLPNSGSLCLHFKLPFFLSNARLPTHIQASLLKLISFPDLVPLKRIQRICLHESFRLFFDHWLQQLFLYLLQICHLFTNLRFLSISLATLSWLPRKTHRYVEPASTIRLESKIDLILFEYKTASCRVNSHLLRICPNLLIISRTRQLIHSREIHC